MTLIALTLNHGYPVMMADLLISSTESDGKIETPTFVNGIGSIFNKAEGKQKPLTLKQKLYVINERLCVALGGRGDQMFTFLGKLKTFYGTADFDDKDFLNFLDSYQNEDRSELIAIILKSKVEEGEIIFTLRTFGALRVEENFRHEKVIAGGSGTDQFIEFIKTDPKFGTDISNTDAILVMNQYLMSYWLGHEVSRAETLSENWGAGYEMIYFRDGKFIKLEEYTVILLTAKIGKGITFDPVPINTIMVSYQDGVLLIKAYTRNSEKIFAIPAIDESRKQIELNSIESKHETLLITYIIKDEGRNREYFPTVVFPKNKNEVGKTPIVVEKLEDNLCLHVDPDFDKHVLAMINRLAIEEDSI